MITDVGAGRMTMSIDDSGEYWIGSEAADLDEYLRAYSASDNLVDRIVHPKCACGNATFRVRVDSEEGCAQRICSTCESERLVCDSGEHLNDADPEEGICPCGANVFELAVGFSHRKSGGALKWITLATRCTQCGVLGAIVDWKIDYTPTEHLYEMA